MADGIDIRLKRAVYNETDTNPYDTVANYRLLYGEAIYLTDLDYLVIGRKGSITYTEDDGTSKTITCTGEYTSSGYVKDGFSVKELIKAGYFISGYNNIKQYLTDHREPKTQTTTEDKIYLCGINEGKQDLLYDAGIYVQPGPVTDGVVDSSASVLIGAAWNDFAELRKCKGKPGDVVVEVGDGSLEIASARLLPGASIVSDTCGIVIGPQEKGYVPIAVAGRVLAKYSGELKAFTPGLPVCTGENGTISAMTRNEIINYPDCIVGYVSEIPTYKEWNHVKVNDRIWIKVK